MALWAYQRGASPIAICRAYGIPSSTLFRWISKFQNDVTRLKQLLQRGDNLDGSTDGDWLFINGPVFAPTQQGTAPARNPFVENIHHAVALWVRDVLKQGHQPVAVGSRPVTDGEGRQWVVEILVTQRPK